VVDFDGDGQLDILSGSWPGELYVFRGKGKGQFAAGEKIKGHDGKEIKLGSASTVFAADWNGDGLLDLLVGDINGNVWLVPNEGSPGKPAFGKPRKLEADGKAIQVAHGDSHPVAADWDGDGKLDLIVGTGAGSVVWYRNVGTNKEPKLAAAKTLVAEIPRDANGGGFKKNQCGMRAKVCVVDLNGDGRLDLLVGDAGYTMTPPPNLTEEEKAAVEKARQEYGKLFEKYQSLFEEQGRLANAPKEEAPEAKAEREKKLKEIQKKLQPFNKEAEKLIPAMVKGQGKYEWFGQVWLFERKTPKTAAAVR